MDTATRTRSSFCLRRKARHPVTVGPGQVEQTKRHGSKSFVQRALHLDPWRLPRSPEGGADGDGMTSRARCIG